MQKIIQSRYVKVRNINCNSLLSWKWAVYDSMLIGVLVSGVLFNIH